MAYLVTFIMSDDILDRYSRDNIPAAQADGGFTPDDIMTKYDREPEMVRAAGKPTRVIMDVSPRGDIADASGFNNRMVSSVPIVGPLFDKAAAATGALVQPFTGDPRFANTTFGQRYAQNLDLANQKSEEYGNAHPVSSLVADLAGPSLAVGPMAATSLGARLLGLKGASLGARAYQGAAGSGAIATGDQLLKGNNPLNQGFLGPVPLSMAGGMIAPAIGEGISAAGSRLMNWLPRTTGDLRGVNSVGRNILVNAIEGETPASITAAKAKFGPSGMLADINNATTDAAGALADIPGQHKQVIREAFRDRAAGQADRILDSLDRNTVPAANMHDLVDMMMNHQNATATPLYEKFRSMQISPTPELKGLIPRLESAKAFDMAEELSGISGRPIRKNYFTPGAEKSYPTAEAWDYVKRGLDRRISSAQGKGDQELSRELVGLKHELLAAIDKTPAGKVYQQARQAFAEPAELKYQISEGQKTFQRNARVDDLASELKGLSRPEQAARVQGARDAVQQIIENSVRGDTAARNTLLTRANRQKLALLFGDQKSQRLIADLEAELHGTQKVENVIGGSQTTPKKERTNAMLPAPTEMGYLSNLDVTKPATFIPEWIKPHTIMEGAKAQRYSDAYRQIAPLLTTRMGEPKFDSLIQSLLQEGTKKDEALRRLTRLGSVATGGVSATLPALRSRLLRQPATP